MDAASPHALLQSVYERQIAPPALRMVAQHAGDPPKYLEEPPVGKLIINSLIVEEASDTDLTGIAHQMNAIFNKSDKGGWMLIQTDGAHNAVWVSPASDVRLEFDDEPLSLVN